MPDPKKGLLKKIGKKLVSKAKDEAIGFVEGQIKDRSKAQRKNKGISVGKQPKQAEPDIVLAGKIQLKDRKKAKQKKKIAKWEKQKRSSAAAGSRQAAFLALDRSIKQKEQKKKK